MPRRAPEPWPCPVRRVLRGRRGRHGFGGLRHRSDRQRTGLPRRPAVRPDGLLIDPRGLSLCTSAGPGFGALIFGELHDAFGQYQIALCLAAASFTGGGFLLGGLRKAPTPSRITATPRYVRELPRLGRIEAVARHRHAGHEGRGRLPAWPHDLCPAWGAASLCDDVRDFDCATGRSLHPLLTRPKSRRPRPPWPAGSLS